MPLGLSRLEPLARIRGGNVEFQFDPNATPAKDTLKVLTTGQAGELTHEAGNMTISGIAQRAAACAPTEVIDNEPELIKAFKEDIAG